MTAQPWQPSVARLEGIVEQIDKRLDSIDRRIENLGPQLEGKIENVRSTLEGKIENVRSTLDDKIDKKIDRLQWRMTSLIVGTWITTMLTMFAILFRK